MNSDSQTAQAFYTFQNDKLLTANCPADLIKQAPDYSIDEAELIRCFQNTLSMRLEVTAKTYHKNIYRVLPWHELKMQDGEVIQERYWQLDPDAPTIYLPSDQAYLDKFDELIREAVLECTEGHHKIACELSGGFDSSLVAIAAHELNIPIQTFTHFDASQTDRYKPIRELLEKYPSTQHQCITGENFDALKTFDLVSEYYGGMPPYIFPMFAYPLFEAVQKSGATLLLSGFGGDECVTSHAMCWRRELAINGQYRELFRSIPNTDNIKSKCLKSLEAIAPRLYQALFKLTGKANDIQQYLHRARTFSSIREMEIKWLNDAHVAYRQECSAVMAHKMGFEYRYPLLNTKLLDWCNRLPIEQKVRLSERRYLANQLLKQKLGEEWTLGSKKDLDIFPATMKQFEIQYKQGEFDSAFADLPLMKHAPKAMDDFHTMLAKIFAYQCSKV